MGEKLFQATYRYLLGIVSILSSCQSSGGDSVCNVFLSSVVWPCRDGRVPVGTDCVAYSSHLLSDQTEDIRKQPTIWAQAHPSLFESCSIYRMIYYIITIKASILWRKISNNYKGRWSRESSIFCWKWLRSSGILSESLDPNVSISFLIKFLKTLPKKINNNTEQEERQLTLQSWLDHHQNVV